VSNAARLARRVIERGGGRVGRLDEGSMQRMESAAVFVRGAIPKPLRGWQSWPAFQEWDSWWHVQAKAVSVAGFLQLRAASLRRRAKRRSEGSTRNAA